MKIKKFALSLVAVAACAGAFGAYESYQQSGESDALLAENVEALSEDGEFAMDFKCRCTKSWFKKSICSRGGTGRVCKTNGRLGCKDPDSSCE